MMGGKPPLRSSAEGWIRTAVFVLAWGGFTVVLLGYLVESVSRAEAGIAVLATACVPVLLLYAVGILRFLVVDRSLELVARLRLQAGLEGWGPERIEARFRAIEVARARGPVQGTSLRGDPTR